MDRVIICFSKEEIEILIDALGVYGSECESLEHVQKVMKLQQSIQDINRVSLFLGSK